MGQKRKSTAKKSNLMKVKHQRVLSTTSNPGKNDFWQTQELKNNISVPAVQSDVSPQFDASLFSCNIISVT